MPYRRRAYRRGRYGSRDKYSVHQKAFSFTAQASPTTTAQLIVPSSATEGMRKVKHLTVNLTPILDQDGGQIWWALVYVPQGTTAGSINLATTAAMSDMYEPNQYVMNCGIVDPTAGPIPSAVLSVATSTTETQSSFSSVTLLVATWTSAALVATLSPSSDLHITPQIYISYEICGARRCSILHTPSGAVILYRPFLSILIQKMEIGDGDYKEMWSSPCSIQPQRAAGGTQGTPYKYIGLGYW